MSDKVSPAAEQQARDQPEADLVRLRIAELAQNPIAGDFDLMHLKAIHAYLFQDLPEHQPGVVRADTDGWRKVREVEGPGASYVVHYVHADVEASIATILRGFGGPATLTGLPADDAAARLAMLYGDLDHAHGFYEGNSRTLREFMRALAVAAGYTLDWTRVGIGTEARSALYVARDVAVLERAFPGLTEARAMATDNRSGYEAWWNLTKLRELQGENSLRHIIGAALAAREPGA